MKRTVSIILSIVMLLSVTTGLNFTAKAEGYYSYNYGDFEYTYWNDGIKVLRYKGDENEIVIPNKIANLPVLNVDLEIGNYDNITSVKMPDTVVCIDYYGLSGFESLETITFSKNLQTITRLACCFSGFTSLIIPDSVKTIGEHAFLCCEKLESITISRSIETIGKDAFYGCTALKDVYFSGSKAEWDKLGASVSGAEVHYAQGVTETPNDENEPPDEPDLNENTNETENGSGEDTAALPSGQNEEPTPEQQTEGNVNTDSVKTTPAVTKPKGTKIIKAKRIKRRITIKWKRVAGVSGYQLQLATNKKFTKNKKKITVCSAKAKSKTVKRIKANKKYFIRIRTYKLVNGKKYYSKWSKTKTVKIK